jgi:3-oxoacyl-[acyl-carrier protein] reductase
VDLKLKGRTALVTGASAGIGRAIAKGLAAEGVKVAIVARREPLLRALADEIVVAGGEEPSLIIADVMPPGAPQTIASEALEALGHVDILVNSAGGSRPFAIDANEDEWEEAMTLNFTRLRQLTHSVLPGMRKEGFGRIVNITGKSEPKRLNGANSAKAAVHMWAKGLCLDIGKDGITINSIAPGFILSEQISRRIPKEELERLARESIPMRYIGDPADIAAVVTFLASPLAHYVTGTVIAVDGGLRKYAF